MKKTLKDLKNFILSISIACYLASPCYFNDAVKSYNEVSSQYKLNMIEFGILIIAGTLLLGICIGINMAEKRMDKPKSRQRKRKMKLAT